VPDLTFEFVPQPWDSMFTGWRAGKYDIAANVISKDAGGETSPVLDVAYFHSGSPSSSRRASPASQPGRLKGKVVGAGTGSEHTRLVEDYLAAIPARFGSATRRQCHPGAVEPRRRR